MHAWWLFCAEASEWCTCRFIHLNRNISAQNTFREPRTRFLRVGTFWRWTLPASIDPLHRSTILSIDTSKSSLSRSGRLLMTMASLNSPRALGRDAVLPPLVMVALRPCKWWNRRSSDTESRLNSMSVMLSRSENNNSFKLGWGVFAATVWGFASVYIQNSFSTSRKLANVIFMYFLNISQIVAVNCTVEPAKKAASNDRPPVL